MLITTLQILAGLVCLVAGGDLLVRGAVGAATRMGLSPLVIGLTLVGFGTSTPELVTSVQAALNGAPGIAFGNIVGSNTANILLILGATALVMPIAVPSAALKRDAAIMLAATLLFAALATLMPLGRLTGLGFLVALAGYIGFALYQERRHPAAGHGAAHDKGEALQAVDPATRPGHAPAAIGVSLTLTLGGLALVIAGGWLLVGGAVALATAWGISQSVIGLTIVAVGTSLPELVTSLMAALRRQTDVAFGNIVGSNIYNVLAIGGTTALIAPSAVPRDIVTLSNPVMIAASLALILFAVTGRRIVRWEGGVLLAGYGLFVWALWPASGA